MLRKLKDKINKGMKRTNFYRLRPNTLISDIPFNYVNGPEELKSVVEEFLKDNPYFSITSSNAISREVFGVNGEILRGKNSILEMDFNLYKLFKDHIEKTLKEREEYAIETIGLSSSTFIKVGLYNSSIKFKNESVNIGETTGVATEITELSLRMPNSCDMELLQSILSSALDDKQDVAKLDTIGEGKFYLICGDVKLLFDIGAYYFVTEKVKEHNEMIDIGSAGVSYSKK